MRFKVLRAATALLDGLRLLSASTAALALTDAACLSRLLSLVTCGGRFDERINGDDVADGGGPKSFSPSFSLSLSLSLSSPAAAAVAGSEPAASCAADSMSMLRFRRGPVVGTTRLARSVRLEFGVRKMDSGLVVWLGGGGPPPAAPFPMPSNWMALDGGSNRAASSTKLRAGAGDAASRCSRFGTGNVVAGEKTAADTVDEEDADAEAASAPAAPLPTDVGAWWLLPLPAAVALPLLLLVPVPLLLLLLLLLLPLEGGTGVGTPVTGAAPGAGVAAAEADVPAWDLLLLLLLASLRSVDDGGGSATVDAATAAAADDGNGGRGALSASSRGRPTPPEGGPCGILFV